MTRKPRRTDPHYPRAMEEREVKRIADMLSAEYNRAWNNQDRTERSATDAGDRARYALGRADHMVAFIKKQMTTKNEGPIARAELRKYYKMWKQSREYLLVKIFMGDE